MRFGEVMKPTFNVFITMNPGSQSLERDLSVEGEQSFRECRAGSMQVMLGVRNFQITWRLFSDRWLTAQSGASFLSFSHNLRDLVSFWDVDGMVCACYQALRSSPLARSIFDLCLVV